MMGVQEAHRYCLVKHPIKYDDCCYEMMGFHESAMIPSQSTEQP